MKSVLRRLTSRLDGALGLRAWWVAGAWLLLGSALWGAGEACAQGLSDAASPILTLVEAERLHPDGRSEGLTRLPDLDIAERIAEPQTRIYRFTFRRDELTATAPAPPPLLGVLIERACQDLNIGLNGVLLYQTRTDQISRFNECHAPHLATLPWELLKPGENRLDVEVTGWPLSSVASTWRSLSMSPVSLGDHSQLRDLHRQETNRRLDVPAVVAGGLLLIGLLMSSLLVFPPREPHLAYFCGMCVLWAAVVAHSVWRLPFDLHPWREGLPMILVAAATWCHQRFVSRYADLQVPMLDRLGWLTLLGAPLIIAMAGSEHLFRASALWFTVSLFTALASTAVFMLHTRQPRRRPMRSMAMVLGAAALFLLLEWAMAVGLLPLNPSTPLSKGLPLCLVLVGTLQLLQFGQKAHQLEVTQRQLEQKIAMAREEIESNFSQLAQVRIEQVTSGERKRIAADLHDDLGAKLLTIVHTSRSDRIAALGREALDEMRLSVRGLTGRPMELSEALADWRTEAMGRLGAVGIDLRWPMPPDDLPQVLGSRTMVQTTRILREVFNNLIRHSQATRCDVDTRVGPDRLQIEIRDNGIGFEPQALRDSQAGLGLLNMAHRARQLQGECVIESRPGAGSTVRLTLPLAGSAPSSDIAS